MANGKLTYIVWLVDRVSTVKYSTIGEEGRLASILYCLPHGFSASLMLTLSSFSNVKASTGVAFVAIVGSGGWLISSVSRPPTRGYAPCLHPCTNHDHDQQPHSIQ